MLAGLAVLPAGAVGIPTAATPLEVDPIYASIETHRKAQAAADAQMAEARRMSKLADEKVGPSHLVIPSMVASI